MKKPDYSIRPMTAADIDEAHRLECENFSDPWTKEMLAECVQSGSRIYLVADANHSLLGLAGVENIAGEGWITNVSVDERYRGQGVGHALMKELIAQGKEMGIRAFTLECRISNTAARTLYESLGFISAGIRPNFYRNPKEDAVIYWRKETETRLPACESP